MANGITLNKEMSNQSLNIEDKVIMFLEKLKAVVKQYDCLGSSVRYELYKEYDSVEYLYYIVNLHDMSPLELVSTIGAIEDVMEKFSKENGIYDFYVSTRILFE